MNTDVTISVRNATNFQLESLREYHILAVHTDTFQFVRNFQTKICNPLHMTSHSSRSVLKRLCLHEGEGRPTAIHDIIPIICS